MAAMAAAPERDQGRTRNMTRIRALPMMLVALWAALATPAEAQLKGHMIRIAIGAPLSGGAASFGVEMKQAVELAIEEQNAAGGFAARESRPTPRMMRPATRRARRSLARFARTRRLSGWSGT